MYKNIKKIKIGITITIMAFLLVVPIINASVMGTSITTNWTSNYKAGDIIEYNAIDNVIDGVGYLPSGTFTYTSQSLSPEAQISLLTLNGVDTSIANNINYSYNIKTNNTDIPTIGTSSNWNNQGNSSNIFNETSLVPNIINIGNNIGIGFNAIPNATNPPDFYTQSIVSTILPLLSNSYDNILSDIVNGISNTYGNGVIIIGSNNINGVALVPIEGITNTTEPISIKFSNDNGTATITINTIQNGTTQVVSSNGSGGYTTINANITAIQSTSLIANYSNSRILNFLSINIIKNESVCVTTIPNGATLGANTPFGYMAMEFYANSTSTISVMFDSTNGAFTTFVPYTSPTTTTTTTTSSTETTIFGLTPWLYYTLISAGIIVITTGIIFGYLLLSDKIQANCHNREGNGKMPIYCRKGWKPKVKEE